MVSGRQGYALAKRPARESAVAVGGSGGKVRSSGNGFKRVKTRESVVAWTMLGRAIPEYKIRMYHLAADSLPAPYGACGLEEARVHGSTRSSVVLDYCRNAPQVDTHSGNGVKSLKDTRSGLLLSNRRPAPHTIEEPGSG